MSTETDRQFATNVELLDRVIDKSLSSDEFITDNEVLAYAQHLSDRELVDTEANRATWIAARNYYDIEASNDHVVELGGVYFTQEQWDAMLRWRDEKVSYGDDKTEIGQATIAYSDLVLRQQALSFATSFGNEEAHEAVVARAGAYLAFLQGDAK